MIVTPFISRSTDLTPNIPVIGYAAQLEASNPTPLLLQLYEEYDTYYKNGQKKRKIGDGITPYNDLPYTITEVTAKDGIVAFAGGGQTSATLLKDDYNVVETVGSAGDSVKLGAAKAGLERTVSNMGGGNDMNLYPAIGEQFEYGSTLLGANVPIAIADGNSFKFVCYDDGVWRSL